MSLLILPFALIWIGVKINMPLGYYALVGLPVLFDIILGFKDGDEHESSRSK